MGPAVTTQWQPALSLIETEASHPQTQASILLSNCQAVQTDCHQSHPILLILPEAVVVNASPISCIHYSYRPGIKKKEEYRKRRRLKNGNKTTFNSVVDYRLSFNSTNWSRRWRHGSFTPPKRGPLGYWSATVPPGRVPASGWLMWSRKIG